MSDSMMMQKVEAGSDKPILSAAAHCPLYPNEGFVPNASVHALTASANGLPELLALEHTPVTARAAARISQLRTRADRGPPVSPAA